MKVVVAGGSGALGRRLCEDLADRGHEVLVLTRSPRPTSPHRQLTWDGLTVGAWARELPGSAIVNLAGELVDRRPTRAGIDLLTRSRVQPTRALAEAAAALAEPVPAWVQASTLAIHGNAGDTLVTEDSPPADGPPQMAGVAKAWEEAARDVNTTRQVVLRTSIVLDRGTPALDRLSSLVRLGAGGRVGSGRQWFSWIHIEDWLAIVRSELDIAGVGGGAGGDRRAPPGGVIVASAPNPVRNAELMTTLREVLHRPPALATPPALVRLGAWALRTDPALALTGRRAVSTRLATAGFTFRHPLLHGALSDLLH